MCFILTESFSWECSNCLLWQKHGVEAPQSFCPWDFHKIGFLVLLSVSHLTFHINIRKSNFACKAWSAPSCRLEGPEMFRLLFINGSQFKHSDPDEVQITKCELVMLFSIWWLIFNRILFFSMPVVRFDLIGVDCHQDWTRVSLRNTELWSLIINIKNH